MLVCSSPRLFAACHVLLRLLMPRHPSCALCSLTTKIFLILMSFLRRILQFFVSTFSALTKLLFACLYGFHFIFPTFLTSLFVNDHRASKSARFFAYMVGVLGFEPRTSSLSGTRSNQLSYTPNRCFPIRRATLLLYMVELKGLEPLTFCLQSRCSSQLS